MSELDDHSSSMPSKQNSKFLRIPSKYRSRGLPLSNKNLQLSSLNSRNFRADSLLDNNYEINEDKQSDMYFELLVRYIRDDNYDKFVELISKQDVKWFLENSELDYEIFFYLVKYQRAKYIQLMEDLEYQPQKNFLLIELYVEYNPNDDKKSFSNDFKPRLNDEEYKFLINHGYGINTELCLVEFYFLLMANKKEYAELLLEKPYAQELRDYLDKNCEGYMQNFEELILKNQEISNYVICLSLKRRFDGIALEIFENSNCEMDDNILESAVKGDCSFFLGEVWNGIKKGNYENKNGKNKKFSEYLEVMLKYGKISMASEAIRNWFETYKEDNIFEKLIAKNEELAM